MSPSVPFRELLGSNLKVARVRAGLSQAGVAALMKELGFDEWRRQTVGNAEKATRRVTVEELVGLALVLNVKPERLIYPESGEDMVSMPSGFTFRALRLVMQDGSVTWKEGRPVAGRSSALELPAEAGHELLAILRRAQPMSAERLIEDGWTPPRPRAQPAPAAERGRSGHAKEDELQPVATAIVTSRLGVLVGRRHDGKPPWTFIAGEVEPGEDAPFAAGREVKEETGLEVEPGEEIGRRVHPKTGRTMIYVAAKPARPDDLDVFVGDERELAEVRWVSLAEADELMKAYGMFEPVHEHLAREIGEG